MSTIELNTYITDAEWEVMRVVWANDRVTSKKVITFYLQNLFQKSTHPLCSSLWSM